MPAIITKAVASYYIQVGQTDFRDSFLSCQFDLYYHIEPIYYLALLLYLVFSTQFDAYTGVERVIFSSCLVLFIVVSA